MNENKINYIFNKVSSLKGVGNKLSKYLKNKKIEKINDLLWSMPYDYTDRSKISQLDNLEVGKINTIKVKALKYNFPRIRNLPNKILCGDEKNKIDIVFFNSREGYIKKILPINKWIVISGKVNFFKNKYQITNPDYIKPLNEINYIQKVIPKYSLTEGLTEKLYRKIIEQVLENLPDAQEWHNEDIIKKNNFLSWKDSIIELHGNNQKKFNSNVWRRLAYDEIFSHLLVLSVNRKRLRKIKKKPKIFNEKKIHQICNNLRFDLTKSQKKVTKEIFCDLKSNKKMFRIIQGDVGSGKTIVSLLCVAAVIESKFQCAIMAPTEILAKQHYNLCLDIFKNEKYNIAFLTGKTEYREKKKIISDLNDNKIDLIIGTHSLFQKKINFKRLGFIIVDEQHKFGVKQRMNLSEKGGDNCDVLLMSATPIPRTMMLATYGDMDISKITEKPLKRKKIITLTKPDDKINELWPLIKKLIISQNQVFWVCPLIDESKFLNYTSAIKKFDILNKKFPNKVGLIHGSLSKEEKENVLKKFLNRKIDILVSTTVIEVGIDFPNANLIIIENSNKFGLAQLHQLRGRVGRGNKQGICILLFKKGLSKNAVRRLKILKSSDDGFLIADEDMKLRGFGDIIGFQQSGEKYFRIADPVHHADLFKLAEVEASKIEIDSKKIEKFNFLMKLFDKAEIVNE